MQMGSMYSGAERRSTSDQSLDGTTSDSVCVLTSSSKIPVLILAHKLDLGNISTSDWIEMERVLILLYIHVNADGPTLPLWAGRRCTDSAWFKLCSSRRTWLYNAKAWASHAQQPTCWVVCCGKPSSWWERVRGSNRPAYSTVPQPELSSER